MELTSLPDMSTLLLEMGLNYDPARLAAALSMRRGELIARGIKVASTLGAFIASVLKVTSLKLRGALEQNALGSQPYTLVPPRGCRNHKAGKPAGGEATWT